MEKELPMDRDGEVAQGEGPGAAEAVQALYRQMIEGWNRRSGEAFAAPFAEDGVIIGFDGSQSIGRAALAADIQRVFDDHQTPTYVVKIREVRFLAPDVAILHAVGGLVLPGQSDIMPQLNSVQSVVATELDGKWRISWFQSTPAQYHGRPHLVEQLNKELRELLPGAAAPGSGTRSEVQAGAPDGDALSLLERALNQTDALIARTRLDQAGLPTPCAGWDLRKLVNHVVLDVQQFTAIVNGERWQSRDVDVIDDAWLGAYRVAAQTLLMAWRDGAPGQTIQTPSGEVPVAGRLSQQIADLAVHAWDIAVATGQSTNLDPVLGRLSLEWARENLQPQFRGEEGSRRPFGLEVSVPEDAPIYDRLAGFFGRDPGRFNRS
jgi:uncharacterized protein (TIGR03086 family)